jgi:hypothetical protein
MRPSRVRTGVAAAAVALLLGGCVHAPAPILPAAGSSPAPQSGGPTAPPRGGPTTDASGYSKVLVIAEENHSYDEIIGSPSAPYLNSLANTFGSATAYNAGYPTQCPSLAAYILLTSGSTQGICDDRDPSAHRLSVPSIFSQVVAAGQQWRNYAEDASDDCAQVNGDNTTFLVRHTPAAYYTSEAAQCAKWDLPMGTPTAGALHDDVTAGTLPAYGFVTPDACDDMHGAPGCTSTDPDNGDAWLRTWLPQIMAAPDYTAHRLVIIITWDEGTPSDNHIPTLVISPTTSHVQAGEAFTHCSTLRTAEEILHLSLLGCAATAPSMVGPFHLG